MGRGQNCQKAPPVHIIEAKWPDKQRYKRYTRDQMDEDRLTIDPPLYLIGKMYSCWRCGAKMPVVAILAPKVEGTEGEICILSGITELPEAILAYIQGRVPTFKRKFSKTIGQ